MPPVSIPPMERPKEASIHVAQYLEDFGEIIRGFLEVRENSWRICGSGRRKERERLGYEYGASTKTLSRCTHICTAVSSLLSTACSTIYWINVDSSRVHCNTAVLSRRWIIALQSTTAAFSSLARFTVLRKVVIGLLQSIQVHWCSAILWHSSVNWYNALDKTCTLALCSVLRCAGLSSVKSTFSAADWWPPKKCGQSVRDATQWGHQCMHTAQCIRLWGKSLVRMKLGIFCNQV